MAEPSEMQHEEGRVRIDLKLGFDCNNRCRFCVQGEKRRVYGSLPTEEVERRIDEASRYSDEIVFTGGEVTIRPDLVRLVGHARRRGFQTIQIQTNGRMLAYRKLVDELISAGATEFSPALHGHNAELHDYLTRSPGSFDQTVAGMRNLKRAKVPVITNTVITRSNFRHLEAIGSLLIELGVSQYQLAFVHALGEAEQRFESVVPRMELIAPHVMASLEVAARAGTRATTEAIPPCVLPGFEHHLAEWILPDARIYDAKSVLDSYAAYRFEEGKAKGPRCAECGWYRMCEGTWREYPARFGWDELKPVSAGAVRAACTRMGWRKPV